MSAPTHIEKIEAGIVDLLKAGGLDARFMICAFPDDPDRFDTSDFTHLAIVQYSGSRYKPGSSHGGAQTRLPSFAIHLSLRPAAGGVRGPYHVEQIRLALQAQKVEGAQLQMVRDGLVDAQAGLWRYLIEVVAQIPAVPLPAPTPQAFVPDFMKEEA